MAQMTSTFSPPPDPNANWFTDGMAWIGGKLGDFYDWLTDNSGDDYDLPDGTREETNSAESAVKQNEPSNGENKPAQVEKAETEAGLTGYALSGGDEMNLGSTLAGVATLGYGIYDNEERKKEAKRQYEESMAFEREKFAYEKAMQETQMRREDSAYQRSVADMLASGLNPLSGANPASASTNNPTASSPSGTASFGSADGIVSAIMNMIQTESQLSTQRSIAQAQLAEQKRHNSEMETLTSALGNRSATVSERNATVREKNAITTAKSAEANIANLKAKTSAQERTNEYYTSGLGKGVNETSSQPVKQVTESANAVKKSVKEALDAESEIRSLQSNARNAWLHQSGHNDFAGKFQYKMLGSPTKEVKVRGRTFRFFSDENVWKVFTSDGWKRASAKDF